MSNCSNKTINIAILYSAIYLITKPKNPNRVHWFEEVSDAFLTFVGMNVIILLFLIDPMDVPWKTLNFCWFALYFSYFKALIEDDVTAINDERKILKLNAKKNKEVYIDPYEPNIALRIESFLGISAFIGFLVFISHDDKNFFHIILAISAILYFLFFMVLLIKNTMYKDLNNEN